MIPGLLAGICDIVSGLGSMELAELLQPAIAYSRDGIPVDGYHVLHVASNFTRLRQYDETARIFLPNGAPPRASSFHQTGSRLVQADLARSLEDIAKGGPDVFYKGELAERIAQYIAANGGILDYHDLATYRPSFELAERRSTYRDTEQIRTDGYFVPLILNILEHFDLRSYEPRAPEYLHLVIEATRYAFASLLEYLADPQIKPSPIEGLWSKDFSAEIATRIDRKRAAEDVQPVDPWPFETRITGQERPAEDPIEPSRSNHDPGTTQVIAADEAGNVATFNLTHSGAFGSMVTVPGTGILLNGAMTSMDPEPGKAHSIHPNRRQMNFCAPVLVLSRGAPFFAFSGSGGRSIISCQTYVLSHMIDHQMTGQEAIEAPRTHCETRQVFVDSRVGRSAIRDLRAIGHNLEVVEETFYAPYFERPVVIEKVDGDPPHYRSGISQCHRAAAVGL